MFESAIYVEKYFKIKAIAIEADGNYSTFYPVDRRKIVISKTTKDLEETLTDQGFHRIHKFHIVNINKMSYLIV
ncbi:MAG: LytTR family transcriptional regulator [Bacteroidales bacterium]|nr:LytTR family transcriptional regulator [Bacteroidales bacterium]MCF8404192.1 LytTR family transcriptional regulator [Bacteroidales bacterium]